MIVTEAEVSIGDAAFTFPFHKVTIPRIIGVRNRPILTLIFRVMSELAFCNHLNIGDYRYFSYTFVTQAHIGILCNEYVTNERLLRSFFCPMTVLSRHF